MRGLFRAYTHCRVHDAYKLRAGEAILSMLRLHPEKVGDTIKEALTTERLIPHQAGGAVMIMWLGTDPEFRNLLTQQVQEEMEVHSKVDHMDPVDRNLTKAIMLDPMNDLIAHFDAHPPPSHFGDHTIVRWCVFTTIVTAYLKAREEKTDTVAAESPTSKEIVDRLVTTMATPLADWLHGPQPYKIYVSSLFTQILASHPEYAGQMYGLFHDAHVTTTQKNGLQTAGSNVDELTSYIKAVSKS